MNGPPARSLRLLLGLALLVPVSFTSVSAQTAAPASTSTTSTPRSLTLDQALASLTSSPQIQRANLALAAAQSSLNAAQAALNLNVSVGGSANYTSSPSTSSAGTAAPSTTGSLNLTATAGVLPWASNRTALAQAQRSLNYAKALRQENINGIRLNAVQQYQNAYLAQLNVTAASQSLQSARQELTATQTQRRQNNATQESLLQAQAAVQTAQASQKTAQTALETARRSLAATLGISLNGVTFDTPPSLPGSLDQAGLTAAGVPDVNTLVTQTMTSSSDVIQAQNTLASAQVSLDDLQRQRTLPNLTVSANYGSGGSGLNTGLNLTAGTVSAGYTQPLSSSSAQSSSNAQRSLNIGVTGSYNIYSPAANAQITAGQAQVAQAQLSLTLAGQTVELAVRQRYDAALSALSAVAARTTLEQSALVALQTARAKLAAGTATQNNVTAAQAAYAQAQSATQTARAAAALAIVALQDPTGQTVTGGTP
ncbi:TolC family protein [Deinococcus sp.]|uniref:TolC family protein n=1 Tax=Deinococcus sp. TaxID=47478 RepID=UPI003B5AA94E